MTNFAFPQDDGTGHYSSGSGDDIDAANFAWALHAVGFTNFVVSGLTVSPNYSTPSFTLNAGKAVIKSATSKTNEDDTRTGASYVVEFDGQSDIDLTPNAVNAVYLVIGPTAPDDLIVQVESNGTMPSADYIELAEINTTNNTSILKNRDPFDEIDTSELFIDGASGVLADAQTPTIHDNAYHSETYLTSDDITDLVSATELSNYALSSDLTDLASESWVTNNFVNETALFDYPTDLELEAILDNYVYSFQAGRIYVSDTPPSSPDQYDIWFDTSNF
jgi:hypothetical protein